MSELGLFDDELRRLLAAIVNGAITDPEQCRHILRDAERVRDDHLLAMSKDQSLLCDAKAAFLTPHGEG